MKVLIIDDSDYKIQGMRQLVAEMMAFAEIRVAKSFQSGMREMRDSPPDLLILDMALPTSEGPDGRSEGRMRLLGGRDILAEMHFDSINCSVIVVTQFDHFGEPPKLIHRDQLFADLRSQFPTLFLGGVYYSNVDSTWLVEVKTLITEHILKKDENTNC